MKTITLQSLTVLNMTVFLNGKRYFAYLTVLLWRCCKMTVLIKRLTVFRFLTVPPSAVHGLPKYDGIPPSTGTDVQHGKITSGGNFPEDYPEKKRLFDFCGALPVVLVVFFFLQHRSGCARQTGENLSRRQYTNKQISEVQKKMKNQKSAPRQKKKLNSAHAHGGTLLNSAVIASIHFVLCWPRKRGRYTINRTQPH